MAYDRNRLTNSGAYRPFGRAAARGAARSPRMVQLRLWLEAEAMDWRTRFTGLNKADDKGYRRDCVELQRRARLDPRATPLRRLPG